MNVAGALLMALFGLLVALVPPRGKVQLGFGLFAASWAAATMVVNLVLMSGPGDPWLVVVPWLALVFTTGAVVGLGLLWVYMPAPLDHGERRLLLPAVLVALPFFAWMAYLLVRQDLLRSVVGEASWAMAGMVAIWGAWAGLLVLLVLRFMRSRTDSDTLRQIPVLSAALAIYLAVNARWVLPGHPDVLRMMGLFLFVLIVLLGGLWLYASTIHRGHKAPRNVALVVLSLAFLGFLHDALLAQVSTPLGIDGVARVATVVVLAVAILRFQALGVHARLRFGISKSVLAAVFIATFFVASEAAKLAFSEFAGNQLVGIAAAGVLVFAISPLQRLADRFATKAVPEGAPGGRDRSGDPEESYRNALRWALRDGRLSRTEEDRLLVLAEDLGITARRAIALRSEVEAEPVAKPRKRKRAGR